jgi:sporulation protein YlmC with PRC-barrel domain
MKSKIASLLLLSSAVGLLSSQANAQIAGTQPLGITVQESEAIVAGWSVKKSILNKPVVNENGARVGVIHDIIVAPDRSVSFAIIAVSQFLGVPQHDVAIPVEQLDLVGGRLVLPGATKAAIKSLPEFEYTKVKATPQSRSNYEGH